MRKYYLFKLKNIKNNYSKEIYNVLENLFYLNKNKIKYGYYIFNNICLPINKENIINKLKNKFLTINNHIIIRDLEETIIQVNNCFIIIETNKNISIIFKYLNEIDKNFIVCDFENKDYFYLNEFVILNLTLMI